MCVQLSIASRLFFSPTGAPGALPDAMFDALRAAQMASLHFSIYESRLAYNQMGSFSPSSCLISTLQRPISSWGVKSPPPGAASPQMSIYESRLPYGELESCSPFGKMPTFQVFFRNFLVVFVEFFVCFVFFCSSFCKRFFCLLFVDMFCFFLQTV